MDKTFLHMSIGKAASWQGDRSLGIERHCRPVRPMKRRPLRVATLWGIPTLQGKIRGQKGPCLVGNVMGRVSMDTLPPKCITGFSFKIRESTYIRTVRVEQGITVKGACRMSIAPRPLRSPVRRFLCGCRRDGPSTIGLPTADKPTACWFTSSEWSPVTGGSVRPVGTFSVRRVSVLDRRPHIGHRPSLSSCAVSEPAASLQHLSH